MRDITVILCLDDDGGMMFNNRRQSRDRVLIDELCGSTNEKIHIHSYSLCLFSAHGDRVTVCDDPLASCPSGGICFLENISPEVVLGEIARLIIYRWNRRYPSDLRFNADPLKCGFTLESESEFAGSSHEKITKGVYRR